MVEARRWLVFHCVVVDVVVVSESVVGIEVVPEERVDVLCRLAAWQYVRKVFGVIRKLGAKVAYGRRLRSGVLCKFVLQRLLHRARMEAHSTTNYKFTALIV